MKSTLTILLLIMSVDSDAPGTKCTSPEEQVGVCRVIQDCPSQMAVLTSSPSQEKLETLRRAGCGFEGTLPIVCCTDNATEIPSTPYSAIPPIPGTKQHSTPSGEATPQEVTAAVEPQSPDLTHHPNLKLLEHDFCGPFITNSLTGEYFADVFEYPWIARLGYNYSNHPGKKTVYACEGTLISARYVLTTAHCIHTEADLNLVTVKLGEHTIGTEVDCRKRAIGCIPPPIDMDVEQTIVHPGYDQHNNNRHHDIALVRLAKRLDFQPEVFVRPVCLPISAENRNWRFDNTTVTVAGWGLGEDRGENKNTLKQVHLSVVALNNCQDIYNQTNLQRDIIPQQLCAGGKKDQESCIGDSGGPLMYEANVNEVYKIVQFGIFSYGPGDCHTVGVPSVYTRVALYVKWILDTMVP